MARPNPRVSNGAARRKLRARVLATQVQCWLCGGPVDVDLPHGLPASPEVDEIIPVSKGGDPLDPTNVALAHRLCNQRRGNRDPSTVKRITPAAVLPLETSRRW